MTNHVRLDNVDHADLTVLTGHGPAFGQGVNQALLHATEFEQAQRDYPILFRRSDTGAHYAVALLGLDLDENLFVGATGWQARYIPAVLERGPFMLGPPVPGGDGPAIHIDLDDPHVGAPTGEPLFLRHGGQSPYLQRVGAVLDTLRRGMEASNAFFAALAEHDLIQPVTLEIKLDGGTQYIVGDVFTVAQDRLAALRGEALERLHGTGVLRAATMAIASLANIPRLIALKNAKIGG